MDEFGVSRTVVREALSKLQASGVVQTRHGVGTFVVGQGEASAFRIGPEQMETLRDVIAVLELRIGVESEAAALAAQRRSDENLAQMRAALAEFSAAIEQGRVITRRFLGTGTPYTPEPRNSHFADLLGSLGSLIIPRARLDASGTLSPERLDYLRRVNTEHESILDAIAAHDSDAARAAMRTHLSNSRERRRRANQREE